MATGREYLQSILSTVSQLQNMPDHHLDSVRDGLERVDDELSDCLTYLSE